MARTPTYRLIDHKEMGESVVIKTSWDPEFVEALKSTIPAKGRRWDPEAKVWCVDRQFEDDAFSVVVDSFGEEPEWDEDLAPDYPPPKPTGSASYGSPRPAPAATTASPWSVLGLMPNADPDVAKAAYRILSRKWHPDHGGSNEKMASLNLAWETVKKDLNIEPKPETEEAPF